MQLIDGTTIELTRGDILNFDLSLKQADGSLYEFKPEDKISFSVYNREKMNEAPVLQKIIEIEQASETVSITCTSEETKIGGYINKPLECWYEIVLNDERTVLGYDKKGPKIFKLYPEGYEENEQSN